MEITEFKENTREVPEPYYPQVKNPISYIGVYDFGFKSVCNDVIKMSEDVIDHGIDPTGNVSIDNFNLSKNHRDDDACFYHWEHQHINDVGQWLIQAFRIYQKEYGVPDGLHSSEAKYHRVKAYDNGYAIPHYEQGTTDDIYSTRHLVWLIYLNDIDPIDGGSTEFPKLGIHIQPKAGRIIIWPAGVTHLHKGNTPFVDKHYLTGWYTPLKGDV